MWSSNEASKQDVRVIPLKKIIGDNDLLLVGDLPAEDGLVAENKVLGCVEL